MEVGLAIAPEVARQWLLDQMKQGTALAHAAIRLLDSPGHATALVPDALAREVGAMALEYGHVGLDTKDGDKLAIDFFDFTTSLGARTLIVEDDVGRKGDPTLGEHVMFLGDRVLSWTDLSASPDEALALRWQGAFGYPLNAFVCDRDPSELRIHDGRELDSVFIESVVASTRQILVSAYDNCSYVVWWCGGEPAAR